MEVVEEVEEVVVLQMYGVILCCCRWPVLSKRLPGTKGGFESAGRSTKAIWKAVKESAAAPPASRAL
jgi:hypothetical protein